MPRAVDCHPVFLLMVVVGLAVSAGRACAETPALTREFMAQFDDSLPPPRTPGWRYVSLQASCGAFARSPRAGSAALLLSDSKLGGRVVVEVRSGAFSAGADGVVDGVHLDADPREYPGRIYVGAIAPHRHSALRMVAGFNRHGYRGADADLEFASPPLRMSRKNEMTVGASVRPSVWGWVRGRRLADDDTSVLNPGVAMVMAHVPIFADRLPIALSAQSDLVRDRLPETFWMIQVTWLARDRSVSTRNEATAFATPGTHPPSPIRWEPFVSFSFANRLDDRASKRLAFVAGAHFTIPMQGGHGQS